MEKILNINFDYEKRINYYWRNGWAGMAQAE